MNAGKPFRIVVAALLVFAGAVLFYVLGLGQFEI